MKYLALAVLLFVSVRSASGQGPGPQGFTQRMTATTFPAAYPAVARDSTVRPSEWKKGALIGIGVGVAAAVLGGLLIHDSFCDANCGFHFNLIEFAGSLAVFGIIGGLIGSTIHHD
jgi:hypothetical protein